MKVAIAGGGIGGLTCALALQRGGHEVTVYEAAPEITPVGAGIWLAPNGQEVLRRLDPAVLKDVQAGGRLMDQAVIVDWTGRTLSRISSDAFQDRYATPRTLAIKRSRLHRILNTALEPGTVVLDRRLTAYTDSGSAVALEFHDGGSATADVLVGADGIHSAVRTAMLGELSLRYSGQTCWRSLTGFRLPDAWAGRGTEVWGDEPGLRAGFSQVTDDEVYLYLTALSGPGISLAPEQEKAELLRKAAGFPRIVHDIIERTPAERLIRSDLVDLPPLGRYVHGRVALLGDAAHPTTPNLGQGANQAMESALVVSRCLRAVDAVGAAAALVRYQQLRMRKAASIVTLSWRMNQLVNLRSRVARSLRDRAMSATPEWVTNRRIRRIYDVDQPSG